MRGDGGEDAIDADISGTSAASARESGVDSARACVERRSRVATADERVKRRMVEARIQEC